MKKILRTLGFCCALGFAVLLIFLPAASTPVSENSFVGATTTPNGQSYDSYVWAQSPGPNGSLGSKSICDVQPNWTVQTLAPDLKTPEWTPVTRASSRQADSYVVLVLQTATELRVTATHRLWVNRGGNSKAVWLMAGGIAPGDQVWQNSDWVTVTSGSPVTNVSGSEKVCNIRTSSGTFLVNGVLARD